MYSNGKTSSGASSHKPNGANAVVVAAPRTNTISRLAAGLSAGKRKTGCLYFATRSGAQPLHLQRIDAPLVRLDDRELKTTETDFFTTTWQAAKLVHNEAADGVVFLVLKLAVKILVKVLYARQRPDGETRLTIAIPVGTDELSFFVIVLVLDLADDFLEKVLNGQKACNTTILINDDRQMAMTILVGM